MNLTEPTTAARPGRKRALIRAAAVLQLLQGVLMEGTVFVGFFVLLALDVPQESVGRYFEFRLDYLQDNLYEMMLLCGVFAALRVIASVGLLRGRAWGAALTVVNCVVTLVLMVFLLPAGLADGVFCGGTIVLLAWALFGDRRID
jgi:uncharacterized membrane protein (DUF2068 family)